MKLRKHRREAKKLAAKVSANRTAAAGFLLREQTKKGNGETTGPVRRIRKVKPPETVRYRVEIWKEDPEIRANYFSLEYKRGHYKTRDLANEIANRLLEWIELRVPKGDRWPVEGASYDPFEDTDPYHPVSEDIPF